MILKKRDWMTVWGGESRSARHMHARHSCTAASLHLQFCRIAVKYVSLSRFLRRSLLQLRRSRGMRRRGFTVLP